MLSNRVRMTLRILKEKTLSLRFTNPHQPSSRSTCISSSSHAYRLSTSFVLLPFGPSPSFVNDGVPIGHRPSVLRPHPRLLGPLTSTHSEEWGWRTLRVDCWAYRMVFTSESSRSRGVVRKFFGGYWPVARCSDTLKCLDVGLAYPVCSFQSCTGATTYLCL